MGPVQAGSVLEERVRMSDPILTLASVGKRFPGVIALDKVSFELERGETHILLGENGAGKSTLINLLGGVFTPDEGTISFDGAPYQPARPTDAFRRPRMSLPFSMRISCGSMN